MRNKPRKSNENNFMTLLNFIADPAVIVAEKGQILLVNNTFEDLTGLSKKKVIGKVFLEVSLLTPESKAILLKNLRKRMQGLPVEPYEITFTDKTGKARCAEVKAKKIDYAGRPADLVIFRDITRRKENARRLKEYSEKMEALVDEKAREIKENKEKLEKIFNSSPDAITVVNLNGNIIECNEAALHLLGFSSRDDLIGKDSLEMVSPKARKKASLLMEELFRNGSVKDAMLTFLTKDGKEFPAEASASIITDTTGNPVGFVTITRDITEREKAEEALRASEKHLEEILNSVLTGVVIINEKTHQIVDANPNALKTIGASKDQVIEKVCHRFICPAEKGKCPISDLGQTVDKSERVLLRANGERIPILKTVTTMMWRGHKYLIESFIDITERKKAEEALRESEEKYRKQFEEALDAIFVADAETGIIIDCNRAASELVGREKSELVGEHQRILPPPQQIEGEFSRTFNQHLKEKEGQILETQVITKRGEIKDVAIKANVIELRGKKLIHGTFKDITERKRAEWALKQEEERFRDVVASTDDWIWETDPEGKYTYASPMVEQFLGYKPEEVLGKYFYTFFVPEEKEQLKEAAFNVFSDRGRFRGFVNRNIHKNGEIVFLETSGVPIFDNDGQFLGYRGADRNVTESKIMEEQLAALNFYGGMLSSAKSLPKIYELTLDAMQQLLGSEYFIFATIDRGILRPIYQRGYPEPTNFELPLDGTKKGITVKVAQTWTSVLAYNVSENKDYVEITNGIRSELAVPIVVDEKVVGVLNAESKKLGAFNQKHEVMLQVLAWNVATAMSNVRNLEEIEKYSQQLEKLIEKRTEQLKQTQAKLVKSERLATIGELAAMVGHDLRNPLTGIMGAAYYLKTKHSTEIGAKGKEMLETIETAINYSNKIINDLLEYSRDLKLKLTETTPKTMLQNALSLLEVPENIQIIDATENEPMVKADTEKIRAVFVNIIQNAIDAMPESGTLTIKSRKLKGKLEIAFKDTGTGMSEETLSKLKGGVPLFTTKAKGMGFGVPICKRIVEAHGGKICVKSTDGKGTTVTITIPVNPKPLDEGEEKWIFNESMLTAITTKQRHHKR